MEVAALHRETNRLGKGLDQHIVHLNAEIVIIDRPEPVAIGFDAVKNALEVVTIEEGMEKKGRGSVPNHLQSSAVLDQGRGVLLRFLHADESERLRNAHAPVP